MSFLRVFKLWLMFGLIVASSNTGCTSEGNKQKVINNPFQRQEGGWHKK